MAVVDLIMPKMGESIMEATILKWVKQPGDAVKMDETILEIATDKVDSEVPSTAAGVIESVLFNVNDVVPVGTVIAKIRTEGSNGAAETKPVASVVAEKPAASVVTAAPVVEAPVLVETARPAAISNGARFYSPLVLNIATSEGISMSELEQIAGSGNEGRVTKKDILEYVAAKKNGGSYTPAAPKAVATETPKPAATVVAAATTPSTPVSIASSGNVEIIEMDRMRKLIAKHMVDSKHTSPHVTSFTEADVTNLVLWREKVKKSFEKRENEKITFTPLFVEAIVKCIKKFPLMNSSIDGERILVKKDINIGMATALPSGNLIVPVIKNADQLNLLGLTKQVNNLANAARNNKLKPDDTTGGTFTLTNVGTFGSLMGTPIINQPQVAILAVGAIKKRPMVVETEQGDSIAIRHMMYLSMSYDHRIIDGSLGASFLTAVAKELEAFDPNREI
ncbi:MAG: 2-oxo acid dehydrogenase subunit E2 [Chitinophagaceae bacterium]|uniref:dihydrolipoamide acetyltransferase family protein n=1 Tax=unclassified Paraflavitalea TaxID=2798305 RepID=UPI003D35619F|nr:2-oxo acid dehydrogenase subunit E2 [Chitinophagaceae bacterium]